MSIRRLLAAAALLLALAPAALADENELKLEGLRHLPAEGARLFWIDTLNNSEFDLVVHGRLALINVYDTEPATTIPIDNYVIPKGERNAIIARWDGAPWIGEVRAMVALTDQNHQTVIGTYDFWVMPQGWILALFGVSAVLLIIGIVGVILKLTRPRATLGSGSFRHGSSHNVPYEVEADDSVVTIGNKLGVGWQDIVRINRLKPPYTLKPGRTILVPRHALQRPGAAAEPEKKA